MWHFPRGARARGAVEGSAFGFTLAPHFVRLSRRYERR
jgi:hypothetical protein